MTGLIILGVILAIIIAFLLIPVGADISYVDEKLTVSAKIGGMLKQVIPRPPADPNKPPKEKKPPKPKKEKKKPAEGEPKKKKLSLSFTRDELLELVKAMLKGLGKFRKMSVDRFMLHYVAAGFDPYDTAMTYGYVNAALSSLAPICANRYNVKSADVTTDVDFTADAMKLDFALTISIRIGQIFGVINSIIFGALRILLKNKVRLSKERRMNTAAQPDDTVADTKEINKENIQAQERMDSNG